MESPTLLKKYLEGLMLSYDKLNKSNIFKKFSVVMVLNKY